jgi:hypothetical protein
MPHWMVRVLKNPDVFAFSHLNLLLGRAIRTDFLTIASASARSLRKMVSACADVMVVNFSPGLMR